MRCCSNPWRSSNNVAIVARGVEAVYLQTASASTRIASASKKIHQNFADKLRPERW